MPRHQSSPACPYAVAINTVTNKIYVANAQSSNVTVIDGATNATTALAAGSRTIALAVNDVTNRIYVANQGSNNVTVIGSPAVCPDTSFAAIVRNGVAQPHTFPGGIGTTFQSGCGLTLKQAAQLGGYDHFN